MDGHLSGDQLTLYNDGGSFQIEDIYTEIDGEQVLNHVRIETSRQSYGRTRLQSTRFRSGRRCQSEHPSQHVSRRDRGY